MDLRNIASAVVLTLHDCQLAEGIVVRHAALPALDLSGCQLSHRTGSALNAEGVRIGGQVFLRNGFKATGAGEGGAVRLFYARIQGS